MVQLQTFTTSEYLLKNNCLNNIHIVIKSKEKMGKLFDSFEISKNIISRFSRRPLIGQNGRRTPTGRSFLAK